MKPSWRVVAFHCASCGWSVELRLPASVNAAGYRPTECGRCGSSGGEAFREEAA